MGYNFILKDGIITFELKKQYKLIENGLISIRQGYPRLELTSFVLDKAKTAQNRAVFDILSWLVHEIRTGFMNKSLT